MNDVFQLENEEMVCVDSPVNYDKLHQMHVERNSINKNLKKVCTIYFDTYTMCKWFK